LKSTKDGIGYDLKIPDKIYSLKSELREISGIHFFSDSVIAIEEDEDAAIFFLNLKNGEVYKQITFGKSGDFEDLEIIGDTGYMLKSDGKLFKVFPLSGTSEDINVTKYATGLSKENNTEGLCFDARQNKFLIACKGIPGTDGKYENKKAIYTYDLFTKTLSTEPFILIDNNEVMDKAGFGKTELMMDEIKAGKNTSDGTFTFQPSGIAIHPLTDQIYVISSVGKLLVVLNRDGKISDVIRLPHSQFSHPEGITFDSAGNLYISNEGGTGRGNILKFNFHKHEK
jgi:uncharacterized protein YjiK